VLEQTNIFSPIHRRALFDRLVSVCLTLGALLVTGVFVWIVLDLASRGLSEIDWAYLTETPSNAGRAGGIWPMIQSTIVLLGVCLVAVLPLGLGAALLLGEFAQTLPRLASALRGILDVLAGVPSIVYGLFGNAVFCKVLGMGFSLLSGGLTLACMALPLFVHTVASSLTRVPEELRHGSAALALSRWTTCRRILLPAALPGVIAGLILSTGRALAETAALIFTSGYVDRSPRSLLDSGRAISVHVYDLAMNVAGGEARAAAAALVLVVLLLGVNAATVVVLRRWSSTSV
jgi:phosphate transport system permease protein